jgi:glyceraldehyde-3-phosphate dehydrogenase/erythrose-4-phosphate dehydrogenase
MSKSRNKRFWKNWKNCFQRILNRDNVEVVAINDLLDGSFGLLIKYDSVHGRFNGTVEVRWETFVNGKNIRLRSPGLEWNDRCDQLVTGLLRLSNRRTGG